LEMPFFVLMNKQSILKIFLLILMSWGIVGCAPEKKSKAVDELIKSDQEKQDSFKKALEEKGMKLD
jgi:hypothetical protein